MTDPFVLFLAVAAAWFVLRVIVRRWAEQKMASGQISPFAMFVMNAATWALLPLLAVPFVTFTGGRELLVVLAGVMFVFQLALLFVIQRFIERG